MTKKHKHHPPSVHSPAELRPRIDRARREGRFQQALDLAKQLHKHEPSPSHLELLKECYLGRVRQLRGQVQMRDALTVLQVAQRLDETTPAWLEQMAEEMALCGEVRQSLALMDKLTDPAAAQRILALVADAAMQQESTGRDALAASLQPDFDRIVLAFGQVESGHDDEARQTLQGIGLRSPFLEWKLLLRGLQAYWQNDDPCAWRTGSASHPSACRLVWPRRFVSRSTRPSGRRSHRLRKTPCKNNSTASRVRCCCPTCAPCGRPWPTRIKCRPRFARPRRCCRPSGRKRRTCCRAWRPASTGPSSKPGRTTCCAISASSVNRRTIRTSTAFMRWGSRRLGSLARRTRTGSSTSARSPTIPKSGRAIKPITPAP